jgi:hypothetical protein
VVSSGTPTAGFEYSENRKQTVVQFIEVGCHDEIGREFWDWARMLFKEGAYFSRATVLH